MQCQAHDVLRRVRGLIESGQLSNPELYTEDVVIKVQAIIDDAEKVGTLVAAWDSIQDNLEEAHLAWYGHEQPGFGGVHEQKRSKFNPTWIHSGRHPKLASK